MQVAVRKASAEALKSGNNLTDMLMPRDKRNRK
jgi:hypothetical protein